MPRRGQARLPVLRGSPKQIFGDAAPQKPTNLITTSGLTSGDYAITLRSGTLTVTASPLSATSVTFAATNVVVIVRFMDNVDR
jgi:type II secretory pathway component PulC